MTEIVLPVIIPFSSLCHLDVVDPVPSESHLGVVIVIHDEVADLAGNMVSLKSLFYQLVRNGPVGVSKV